MYSTLNPHVQYPSISEVKVKEAKDEIELLMFLEEFMRSDDYAFIEGTKLSTLACLQSAKAEKLIHN